MKHKHTIIIALSSILLLSLLFSGCAAVPHYTTDLDSPFTSLDWASTPEDMYQLEGTEPVTYDSIYQGVTYTYPKEYKGHPGTIKYMFDDQEALMCVAWTYSSDSSEELLSLYEEVHQELVNQFGESGYNVAADTNTGDVWYRNDGDVLIMTMLTDTNKALQYSYLNPVVSKEQMEKAAK